MEINGHALNEVEAGRDRLAAQVRAVEALCDEDWHRAMPGYLLIKDVRAALASAATPAPRDATQPDDLLYDAWWTLIANAYHGEPTEPTVEIGGQVMTQAQYDAARYPLFDTPGGREYLKQLLGHQPGPLTLEVIRRALADEGTALEGFAAQFGIDLDKPEAEK
jgi:hypothetical protein